jgi:hypothetical protein
VAQRPDLVVIRAGVGKNVRTPAASPVPLAAATELAVSVS